VRLQLGEPLSSGCRLRETSRAKTEPHVYCDPASLNGPDATNALLLVEMPPGCSDRSPLGFVQSTSQCADHCPRLPSPQRGLAREVPVEFLGEVRRPGVADCSDACRPPTASTALETCISSSGTRKMLCASLGQARSNTRGCAAAPRSTRKPTAPHSRVPPLRSDTRTAR